MVSMNGKLFGSPDPADDQLPHMLPVLGLDSTHTEVGLVG